MEKEKIDKEIETLRENQIESLEMKCTMTELKTINRNFQ
jgi:hypothetical protein